MSGHEREPLTCCPEWCDPDERVAGQQHGDFCPESPLTITKAGFVTAADGGARAAIEAYLWMVREEGATHEEALEQALAETEEAAVCFVGIGSCGRGWCEHS